MELELVRTIGRKGYGSEELSKPTFCFYDKEGQRLVVLDHGIRKIFIYDRIGRTDFNRVKEFSCWRAADEIQLIGNRLFISGYADGPNQESYEFYYIDITNDQTTFLLPSSRKFGLNSTPGREVQAMENRDIPAIGARGWFDIHRDDAYYTWEGNLKIFKLNIVSGDITPEPFGTQSPHYIKPYPSLELLEARSKRDMNLVRKEKARMSYVRNIFTTSKYVLAIYEGPTESNFRMQFYSLDGDFIKEVPIPAQPDRRMWFDKDKFLYSLTGPPSSKGAEYSLLKYEITD